MVLGAAASNLARKVYGPAVILINGVSDIAMAVFAIRQELSVRIATATSVQSPGDDRQGGRQLLISPAACMPVQPPLHRPSSAASAATSTRLGISCRSIDWDNSTTTLDTMTNVRRLRSLCPGVYAPLPTFFDDDQELDLQSYKSHLLSTLSFDRVVFAAD